jgi:hypothetical protein
MGVPTRPHCVFAALPVRTIFTETDFPFEERAVIDGYGKKHINPFITS